MAGGRSGQLSFNRRNTGSTGAFGALGAAPGAARVSASDDFSGFSALARGFDFERSVEPFGLTLALVRGGEFIRRR